jgi:hypothetical protein
MKEAAEFLIDGYLDDVLTIEQHEELSAWIRSSPENARTFAAAVILHDRLRNEMVISGERQGVSPPSHFARCTQPKPEPLRRPSSRRSSCLPEPLAASSRSML